MNFFVSYFCQVSLTKDSLSNGQGQKKPLPKLCVIENSLVQIIHKLLIFSDIPPRLLLLSLKTLGQFEPTLSCYEIKEPLHSDAVQALAGDTISALKTQTAFIAITPLNY